MKNNEKVSEYISRMILITNEMKACGETLSEQVIIEKVLRSLTPQFDYIVVAIEHSKDLTRVTSNVTIVRSLVILLLSVGQTKKGSQKKQI